MNSERTDECFGQGRKQFRSEQWELHWLARAPGEVGSLAFDRTILQRRYRRLDSATSSTYQVAQEWVVDDTQDGTSLIDETEGDATERETMDKVGGTI